MNPYEPVPPSPGEVRAAEQFRAWIELLGTSRALGTRILLADAGEKERTEKRRDDLTLAFREGYRAGAFQRPTQEEILKWLGIKGAEINRHGDIYIPEQFIEKEKA